MRKKSIEELNSYLKDINSTFFIIKEIERKYKSRRFICFCNSCKQEIIKPSNRLHQKCPVCSNKKVVKGVNDVATTDPWIVDYLKDENDGYKYCRSSHKSIMFKCPICGYERKNAIEVVTRYNYYSCPQCRDKMSRPNKFIRCLLPKLGLQNLQFEYSDDWTNNKVYDAYFEYNNKKYVVEIDGDQHRQNSQWGTYKEQKENDDYKDYLARINSVNMIRITSPFMEYDKVIEGFKMSEIGNLIDSLNIDWKEIIMEVETNKFIEICNYFNSKNFISTKELGEIFNLDKSTVSDYLKCGTKIGLCNFNNEYQQKNKPNSKQIVIKDKEGNIINEYNTVKECAIDYNIEPRKVTRLCRYELEYNNNIFAYKYDPLKERCMKDDIFYKMCEYVNEHKDAKIRDISKYFNSHDDKTRAYLKIGKELNLCCYIKKSTSNR